MANKRKWLSIIKHKKNVQLLKTIIYVYYILTIGDIPKHEVYPTLAFSSKNRDFQ